MLDRLTHMWRLLIIKNSESHRKNQKMCRRLGWNEIVFTLNRGFQWAWKPTWNFNLLFFSREIHQPNASKRVLPCLQHNIFVSNCWVITFVDLNIYRNLWSYHIRMRVCCVLIFSENYCKFMWDCDVLTRVKPVLTYFIFIYVLSNRISLSVQRGSV